VGETRQLRGKDSYDLYTIVCLEDFSERLLRITITPVIIIRVASICLPTHKVDTDIISPISRPIISSKAALMPPVRVSAGVIASRRPEAVSIFT
jgi:hypothetical protein